MQAFVINHAGRLVFPGNFLPDLDPSAFATLEQYSALIRQAFDGKAVAEAEIQARLDAGRYRSRYHLLHDLARHLFWVNRFVLTLYQPEPVRWRDVPRRRTDVFLPVYAPDHEDSVATTVDLVYQTLPPAWDQSTEDRIGRILRDLFRNQRAPVKEGPVETVVGEVLAQPRGQVCRLLAYDPDHPRHGLEGLIEYTHAVPELEALMRQAMVLGDQFPWDHRTVRFTPVGELEDDDVVVLHRPRSEEVARFLQRVRANGSSTNGSGTNGARPKPAPVPVHRPRSPVPPIEVRRRFSVMPRLEALAVRKGELACTNEDLIRNAAYCWSPMTAEEIREKTGIEQRRYTTRSLEEIALEAARAALEKSGRRPEEIGAVVFCSGTSTKMMPSLASWVSGQLGLYQTHASYDLVAACAGLSYGLSAAVRLLQEVQRPVLVVCGEKFSDKIGTVRPSRMIFSDGAAALVIGPAATGEPPDIEIFQTYASGPMSEVDSIILPNPAFGNAVTVYGPEVRALVKRYLSQMREELLALPHPENGKGCLLDAIDMIVPHQANRTMVVELATAAGLPADKLYFDIAHEGNTSSASIPIALRDAVAEGVIDRPMRIFAPGFGAGAVAGYAVVRLDPEIVAV
ncbi:MAG TPA: 3-oxoacyl-[acyl-carrier-protein] synthase III C-terminal domain-containing protein [Gemmatimonadales bacterium]|nr:3-oxoacyl-[acyl-carrier-protein] synthase III C-terminal domain-containing protein [Gemmatimonadales bacterium]